MERRNLVAALLLGLSLISSEVRAQDKPEESPPENTRYIDSLALLAGNFPQKLIKVNDQIYIISRSPIAGNIGVFLGSSGGVYLIDAQWATLSEHIKKLVWSITTNPIKAIINTHYHYDHTNGNLAFGEENIPIVAHINTRMRMMERQVIRSHKNEVQLPYPTHALPTVTFTDKLSFHEGNETIELLYFKNAHTDGDAVVHFKQADIYHTGDIFVWYGLPVIDADAGGNIFALIEAVDTLLARANDRTRFIPGHGPLCSKKELLAYKNLLASITNKIEFLHNHNRPLAEIIKETQALLDPKLYGVSREKFITHVYRMVKSNRIDQKNPYSPRGRIKSKN